MKTNRDILESYGTITEDSDDWYLVDSFGDVVNHAYYSKTLKREPDSEPNPIGCIDCMLSDVRVIMFNCVVNNENR